MRASRWVISLLTAAVTSTAFAQYNSVSGTQYGNSALPTQATWTGKAGDGNWNTAGNWWGGVVPTPSDTAVFDYHFCGNQCSVTTMSANINVAGILVTKNYPGSITQSAGITITIGGSGWIQESGSFIGGNAAVTVTGKLTVSGGSFTATSGTTTCSNGFSLSTGVTFNHNNGLFVASNTTTSSITLSNAAGATFYDLTLTSTQGGGNFSVGSADYIVANNLTLDNQGPATNSLSGASTLFRVANTAKILGNGFISSNTFIQALTSITIDASAATTANALSLDISNSPTITFTGTPIFNRLSNHTGAVPRFVGAVTFTGTTSFNVGSTGTANVSFSGGTNQTVQPGTTSMPTGPMTVNKTGGTSVTMSRALTLSGASQGLTIVSGTLNMNGFNLTVPGTLTISSGASLLMGGGTLTYGTLSNSGTLTP